MRIYVADSNFFIQAHRANYPLDIVVSFWNKVKQLADQGIIISIDKVKKELFDQNDELETWCRENLPPYFFKSSDDTISYYTQVCEWAVSRNSHYLPRAIDEFLDAEEADAFLVGFALADPANRMIVTQEISQPNRRNKIKIPEACDALNIRYINTIGMFRALRETF
ncbi:MAG: DUF4411 family protein [Bacteroidetes bacterium]|nr:MAG: DUF4411 family protein [Bacteroidota bacterium]